MKKQPAVKEENEHFVPDYDAKCIVCGQSPCVTVRTVKTDRLVYEHEMCGPCTFLEAACIDPDEW